MLYFQLLLLSYMVVKFGAIVSPENCEQGLSKFKLQNKTLINNSILLIYILPMNEGLVCTLYNVEKMLKSVLFW